MAGATRCAACVLRAWRGASRHDLRAAPLEPARADTRAQPVTRHLRLWLVCTRVCGVCLPLRAWQFRIKAASRTINALQRLAHPITCRHLSARQLACFLTASGSQARALCQRPCGNTQAVCCVGTRRKAAAPHAPCVHAIHCVHAMYTLPCTHVHRTLTRCASGTSPRQSCMRS